MFLIKHTPILEHNLYQVFKYKYDSFKVNETLERLVVFRITPLEMRIRGKFTRICGFIIFLGWYSKKEFMTFFFVMFLKVI